uniref:Uncharacterized protein n=1 Tax=Helicotheca tamesis TaxID=374047 RepID=A0A6U0G547_9STRA|mmetsp:Transcript_17894/g.24642  ORF Transcript_17894/g.24642 Transcript_17894/m.24642 type:complete len:200 (+) Transcript_17894:224-823(+)|eukprot:CAMPEP_0185732580 /NCGR_PEP_ID=MMETSP1171-20130828/16714_1 /TAXON_ID=374046 /ORGANISM="Helicotheca tamensis, Strain CCMP826" /LENGTH=199 /DNA_ID=CAMNT_0028402105 /DNA_START=116 /DNA_END=715 /DNA_ORIENTATION=-
MQQQHLLHSIAGKCSFLAILLVATTLPTSQCFSPPPPSPSPCLSPISVHMETRCHRQRIPFYHPKSSSSSSSSLNAVTEEDVIAAVEKAEDLWADALEARKKANKLSEEAEGGATSASESADEAMGALQIKSGGTFGMSNVETAKSALNKALDAGSKVDEALKATEEADRLEKLAEEALEASEKALEQHLIDFPEEEGE